MQVETRFIAAAELPPVPWKSGRGILRELSIGPAGADLHGFDWRVSLADIEPGDFPFSYFPGVDRSTVVTGPGMTISHPPGPGCAGGPPIGLEAGQAVELIRSSAAGSVQGSAAGSAPGSTAGSASDGASAVTLACAAPDTVVLSAMVSKIATGKAIR